MSPEEFENLTPAERFQYDCEQDQVGDDLPIRIPKKRLDKIIGLLNGVLAGDDSRDLDSRAAMTYLVHESVAQSRGADTMGGQGRVDDLGRAIDKMPWASPGGRAVRTGQFEVEEAHVLVQASAPTAATRRSDR